MAENYLPLILRKDDHLVLAVFRERAGKLTEVEGSTNRYSGDYRECEVCFNPADGTAFAHATTTHLRYSQVVATDGAESAFQLKLLFEVEMPFVVVNLAFSPHGTYLVAYAMLDMKRTPHGNLCVIEVATGKQVQLCRQSRWPAMLWSANEEFIVRHVQGCLHVLDGAIAKSASAGATSEAAEETEEGGDANSVPSGASTLSKLDLMLAQDKEIEFSTSPNEAMPMLALFKPFYKQQQGTFCLYRLPNIRDGPLYSLSFGRAEAASILWSASGHHIALLVKSERDPSGKSYYGTVSLHLIDVQHRSIVDVKLKGEGETVHDCQWAPTTDELLVVHGKMPRNKTTLFSKAGVALMTFGEAPRNMGLWAPNATAFVLGGSGNLAGDYQFYAHRAGSLASSPVSAGPKTMAARAGGAAAPNAATATAVCTGEFNEKCSVQSWAPDSHCFLCATVFTRLRMDNKVVIAKNNGARVVTEKYPMLYGAHWVAMLASPADYPERPASPRAVTEAAPKPQAYRPPGGTSVRAAALLRRPEAGAEAVKVKPAGPVGATVVVQKKKKGR